MPNWIAFAFITLAEIEMNGERNRTCEQSDNAEKETRSKGNEKLKRSVHVVSGLCVIDTREIYLLRWRLA